MKKVTKLLKGYKHICFLDFEGTQFTSEMIAYGAYFVTIDKKGEIKKSKDPILYYVKAKNKIGSFVENLTGIKQRTLDRVGISFSKAMSLLKKYCGINFTKTIFMTFGNHDMKILNQSIAYNLDSPKDITEVIHKNYIDFQAIISEFIKDSNNNPLSLANYLTLFELKFDGKQHDPKDDAVNLGRLYDAFLKRGDIVLPNYLKTLGNTKHLPEPIRKVVVSLASGNDVSGKDFETYCKDYIK